MIVVTGATGQLGRHVVDGLREQGVKFVAGARNTAADLGVETRELDYSRPETIAPALQGAEKVLLISGSEVGQRVAQHTAVVEAAKKAGVQHIVYTSAPHADTTELVLAPEHKATEEAIRASGIPFTFLRNGWYHENYARQDQARRRDRRDRRRRRGRAGRVRRAQGLRRRRGRRAHQPGHENKVYELTGDVAWTFPEFAEEIAKVAGRPVTYRNLSAEEFQQHLVGAGHTAGGRRVRRRARRQHRRRHARAHPR